MMFKRRVIKKTQIENEQAMRILNITRCIKIENWQTKKKIVETLIINEINWNRRNKRKIISYECDLWKIN